MSRIRFILLGMAATVVLGAFASASASAHRFVDCLKVAAGSKGIYEETKCEKAKAGGEWEKYEIANQEVLGTGGLTKLKSELLGAELLITCKKETFSGLLEVGGASKGEITLEECSIGNKTETFKNCEVPNIKFKLTGHLITKEEETEVEFRGVEKEGAQFVEIQIKNKGEKSCTQKGKFPIQGTQTCSFSNGPIFEPTHTIECTPSGSSLVFNGKSATFEGSRSAGTTSNDSWAVE